MTHSSPKILIEERDQSFAKHLEKCLKKSGFTVPAVVSGAAEVIDFGGELRPDPAPVYLGVHEGLTGQDVGDPFNRLLQKPVVNLIDVAADDQFEQSQAIDPYGYVFCPFDVRQFDFNVATALSEDLIPQMLALEDQASEEVDYIAEWHGVLRHRGRNRIHLKGARHEK